MVVQARGTPKVLEDSSWLKSHVTLLTRDHEHSREQPWEVSDAPEAFIDDRLRHIVGVAVQVHDLVGKWKVSQNRSDADRRGVAEGLDCEGRDGMAGLVRTAGAGPA